MFARFLGQSCVGNFLAPLVFSIFPETREQYALVIGVLLNYIGIEFHLGLMNKLIHTLALLRV